MVTLMGQIKAIKGILVKLENRVNNPDNEDYGKPLMRDSKNIVAMIDHGADNAFGLHQYSLGLIEYAKENDLDYKNKTVIELEEMKKRHTLIKVAKEFGVETEGKDEQEISDDLDRERCSDAARVYGLDIEGKTPEEIRSLIIKEARIRMGGPLSWKEEEARGSSLEHFTDALKAKELDNKFAQLGLPLAEFNDHGTKWKEIGPMKAILKFYEKVLEYGLENDKRVFRSYSNMKAIVRRYEDEHHLPNIKADW